MQALCWRLQEKEAIERRRKALRGREVYMDARADGGLTFLSAPAKVCSC